MGPKTITKILAARGKLDIDQESERVKRLGFQVLCWEDEEYPSRLKEIDFAPPLLYVWGTIMPEDRWAAAIVGTRRVSTYGEAVAREVASVLASSGITVVSGMARGVDSIAHQAALEAGGRTIAVLGSGLDEIYPPEHRKLATRIAERGAVISDYPLGTQPEGKNFPPRNRIISGLSLAVVVVEAGKVSGALITADFALDHGREVFAVPGDIYRRSSQGTNRLIQAGAHPLTSPEDVLEVLNLELVARQEIATHELPEDETERKVYNLLSNEPVHIDDLQVRCGLSVAQISASLAMLELKGRARQVGGMHYIRAREPSATYRVE
jgi:DNA processing protein